MKLLSTPYRWLPRTFFKNINHWFWNIRNGIGNLVTFFEAVWWFRSWDWNGMVELLKVSAKEMRKAQKVSYHTTAKREAKRLLVVETLCKRLQEDTYFDNAGYNHDTWYDLPDYRRQQIAKHATYMAQQDADYLGKMMRFVQYWWA